MRSTRSAPSGSSRRSQGGSPRTEPCVNRLGAMDFDLTSEQQQIRKLAKDFADREIAPGARERDRSETVPKDVLSKMARLGLLGGPVPEQYGGRGVGCVSHGVITEELGRGDSSGRTHLAGQ